MDTPVQGMMMGNYNIYDVISGSESNTTNTTRLPQDVGAGRLFLLGNDTPPTTHLPVSVIRVFGAVSLCLAFTSVVLNVIVIFSVFLSRRLRSNSSDLMTCNLAVGSLMGSVVMLVLDVPVRLGQEMTYEPSQWKCNFIGFLDSTYTIGTVWMLAILGLEKYHSISYPMSHTPSAKTLRMGVLFCLLWLTALMVSSLPFIFSSGYSFSFIGATCLFPFSTPSYYPHALVYYGLSLYIPFVIVVFCHGGIFAIAQTQSRRMAMTIPLITLSFHAPVTHNRMTAAPTHVQISPERQKAACSTGIFLATFIVCYLPYGVMSLLYVFKSGQLNELCVALALIMLRSAYVINAYIYGCRNKVLREAFHKFLRRKLVEYSVMAQGKKREALFRQGKSQSIVRVNRGSVKRRTGAILPAPLRSIHSQPVLVPVGSCLIPSFLPRSISLDLGSETLLPATCLGDRRAAALRRIRSLNMELTQYFSQGTIVQDLMYGEEFRIETRRTDGLDEVTSPLLSLNSITQSDLDDTGEETINIDIMVSSDSEDQEELEQTTVFTEAEQSPDRDHTSNHEADGNSAIVQTHYNHSNDVVSAPNGLDVNIRREKVSGESLPNGGCTNNTHASILPMADSTSMTRRQSDIQTVANGCLPKDLSPSLKWHRAISVHPQKTESKNGFSANIPKTVSKSLLNSCGSEPVLQNGVCDGSGSLWWDRCQHVLEFAEEDDDSLAYYNNSTIGGPRRLSYSEGQLEHVISDA